jgi:hypothetical protein
MWQRGVLLACSLLVALVGIELGLRTFFPFHFAARAASRYDLDPELIYRMRAHTNVSWRSDEFVETSHTNALGMRGAEIEAKRPGETRILALGDSFTYGHGVQDAESYPAVLEALLRARGHDVSVLNAGVPGYNTDQSYAYFTHVGIGLAPDLVILGVHCSDVSDNYESPLYDVADGRLVARGAGGTRLYRFGTLLRSMPRAVQRSHVFALVVTAIEAYHPRSTPPRDVTDLDAWSRSKIRLEIDDIVDRGKASGMTAAVVLMPCKNGVAPYGDLAGRLDGSGAPLLDATTAMERDGVDVPSLFFRTDPHLTAPGNRVLAATIASFLERQGLLALRSARAR